MIRVSTAPPALPCRLPRLAASSSPWSARDPPHPLPLLPSGGSRPEARRRFCGSYSSFASSGRQLGRCPVPEAGLSLLLFTRTPPLARHLTVTVIISLRSCFICNKAVKRLGRDLEKGVKGSRVLTGSPWRQRTPLVLKEWFGCGTFGLRFVHPVREVCSWGGCCSQRCPSYGAHGAHHSAAGRHSTAPATLRATPLVFRKSRNWVRKRN